MKYNFLKEFFEKSNLDTELISIYYDFEENNKSGFFVKNLVHSGLEQYGVSGGNKFILKDYYPGFYETCYDKNYRPTGFGIFDGNDRLKISKNLRSDQFNLFLNFKSYGCNSNYIDINAQNLNEPSEILWRWSGDGSPDNLLFERVDYQSGVRFVNKDSIINPLKTNKSIEFNKENGFFGRSLALNSSGNIMIVGAPEENGGAAYIFSGQKNSWNQIARLTPSDPSAGTFFGYSVAINSLGNIVLIGRYNPPPNIFWPYQSGAAYLFSGSGNSWTQIKKFSGVASVDGFADHFGYSVDLNSGGDVAIVGAPVHDGEGIAYIFSKSGDVWNTTIPLSVFPDAPQQGGEFGWDVSLNLIGNIALVSAPSRDDGQGLVYLFSGSGTNWTRTNKFIGNGGRYGYRTSLNADGNIALITSDLAQEARGRAFIYSKSGNIWIQDKILTPSNPAPPYTVPPYAFFGASAALNDKGNIAIIGAHAQWAINHPGYAYIFTGSGSGWNQATIFSGENAGYNDSFGYDVDLNSIGNICGVGKAFFNSADVYDIFNDRQTIQFNKTEIPNHFSNWSYTSGSNNSKLEEYIFSGFNNYYEIIETGIESKLPFSQPTISISNFLVGKAQTLLNIKSLQNSAKPFDLKIGINNIYKLLIDFSGYNNENIYQSKTLTGELGNQNVASLSVNKNFITLCYNDFLANKNYCEQIDTSEDFFDQEIECYFGDNVGNYNKNIYTGYRGLIDDLFLISGSLTSEQKLQISKNLLKTGLYTGIQNSSNIAYNLLSSGYITTGIIGTGITGYELVESQQVINCQDNCIFYIKSGITGYLTGEIIEYRLVQPSGASTAGESIEIDLYNSGDISNLFAKNYLIMYKPIDDKDLIEIQTYELNSNYLKDPEYSEGSSRFYTENINNNKILVFFNGVNISSGYFDIINSNTFIVNSYSKDDKDIVIYNTASSGLVEYKFEYTGQDHIGNVTYAVGQTYNIFLNGQKLINNYNYYADNRITFNGEFLTINGDYLVYTEDIIINTGTIFETGELYIIEDNKLNSITGSNSNLLNINPDYGSNFVWLNGILQKEFEDHLFTSCNNNSIESYIKREGKTLEIFNREDDRFNII